jgi:predicted dehydrogenase
MLDGRISFGVVGYGYWGPNIVRNVIERPELSFWGLCESSSERAAKFSARYPGIRTASTFEEMLADPTLDAVSIATPPKTHHRLAKQALEAGKHVLVEKPLATNAADAQELVDLAERKGLVIMPGHTFLYSPAVNKVRSLIESGELGEVYFITSSRMNLGLYQSDGVVCDLAPHDLSILLYWLDQPVSIVAASGCTVFQTGIPETAFLTLCFDDGPMANVQVSWLAPRKVRQMVVVGSQRMVQYDDTASDDPIRIYDRGFDFGEPANFGEYQLTYRSGDMIAPRLDAAEPLSLELEDFARAVTTGSRPRSHAGLGVEIVRVLEAANSSLASSGVPVILEGSPGASCGNGATHGNGTARDFTRVQSASRARRFDRNGNGHAREESDLPRTIAASDKS